MILVAFAGPLTNFILAALAAGVYRLVPGLSPLGEQLLIQTVVLNLVLGIFNMIPIPPLDGSKLLFALLPSRHYRVQQFLEQYGMALLLFFIFFGFGLITPIIGFLYRLLVGRWGIL